MKITEAKQIPLQRLVEHLGGRYSHTTRSGELWFFSPFRPDEKTASFKVNEKLNTWHDFGLSGTFAHQKQGSGGDVIDLWCDYNFKDRRAGIKEALADLQRFGNSTLSLIQRNHPTPTITPQNQEPRYKILKIADRISFYGLKEELQRRRISLKLADKYLKQGHILDTANGNKYTCFLFENDKGGYEVSIPNPKRQDCFKTCIGQKASTRILTNSDDTNSADVFEGFWDFLSWLEMKNLLLPRNHSYILNSTSMVAETCEKIIAFKETVKYAFLFMDNDEAGFHATHAIAEILEREDISVGSFEYFYKEHKDLNAFWVSKPKLI